MKKNPNIVLRTVKPATFLVDITKCYNRSEEALLEINEMGVAIWSCIKGDITREDIISAFLSMLSDEKEENFVAMVTNDVNNFLDLLIKHNCVWG